MKGVIQISSIISTIQKLCASVFFFNVTFLEALAPLRDHKDGLEMFGVADLQNVSIERPHCPIASEIQTLTR